MAEQKESCVKPAKGPVGMPPADAPVSAATNQQKEVVMTARVGKPAPDFEANAFADGVFKNISLSEFKGQWVVLCFYPGDFTFV
ncbi:MAG: redoxin domain-containing protein [Syntrophorhabdaceae bacterium]|nr:redoxin domain-containing protein [Syntrophorhabdaceae bacterium]